MARRADRDEGDALAPLLECLQGGQARPGAARAAVHESGRTYVSTSALPRAAFPARNDARRGPGRPDRRTRQLVHGRLERTSGRHDLVFGSESRHAFHDGDQAGRGSLGMTGTAVVLRQPRRPGDDERRHAGPRRRGPNDMVSPNLHAHRTGAPGPLSPGLPYAVLHAERRGWWDTPRSGSTVVRGAPLVRGGEARPEPGPGQVHVARAWRAASAGRTSTSPRATWSRGATHAGHAGARGRRRWVDRLGPGSTR